MKNLNLITLILILGHCNIAKSQNFNYPGKSDYYISGVVNLRPSHSNADYKFPSSIFQGIKAGYYLTDFISICLESGFEKHSKKANEFVINDKVDGRYAKVGLEFYTNFLQYAFKSKPNFRVTYGFSYGIVKQTSSRTYKYSGQVYGDKIETVDYNIHRPMAHFNVGLIYAKNNIRFTSKLMAGNHFKSYYSPYTIYGVAGSPNNFSFEFSVGYHLIKTKSKPFTPAMEGLLNKIFVK